MVASYALPGSPPHQTNGRVMDWISVKERLPDFECPQMLVFCDGEIRFGHLARPGDRIRFNIWDYGDYDNAPDSDRVTHWAYLDPPAPDDKGGE